MYKFTYLFNRKNGKHPNVHRLWYSYTTEHYVAVNQTTRKSKSQKQK